MNYPSFNGRTLRKPPGISGRALTAYVGHGAEWAFTDSISARPESLSCFLDEDEYASDLTNDTDDGDPLKLDDTAVTLADLSFQL